MTARDRIRLPRAVWLEAGRSFIDARADRAASANIPCDQIQVDFSRTILSRDHSSLVSSTWLDYGLTRVVPTTVPDSRRSNNATPVIDAE